MPATRHPDPIDEDLVFLAGRAAALAPRFCRGCLDYHTAWPALRLIDPGGVELDRPYLVPLFRSLAGNPANRHWLIAGMADTGLLATIGQALWPEASGAVVTLVDRCRTPLETCREFAAAHAQEVRIVPADLDACEPPEPQDVIFAHSVLSHLPVDARLTLLRRFRHWLSPRGSLVLSVRIDDALDPDDVARSIQPARMDEVTALLVSRGVRNPDLLRRLSAAIARELIDRTGRRGAYPAVADVVAALRGAGFGDVEVVIEYPLPPRRVRPSGRRQRRAILVARPGGPGP